MATDSTKYFCKREATSARLICVEASLSVEYRYDGEHGKYYFGARYFDPFFGMWMSPDPATVLFREVYAPLKWRDFIEKDILQRSNVEAVLLKQSFRASAQFANPYTYGGDPLNYVDPNGEAVHILVGAIIGAVVGTVNGVIQCTSAGGGSCGKAIGVGFVGGAVVGGAAGGAVGGAGNYVNQSIVNGGFNTGDLWESTWKGAAAGAVGGGAGAFVGNYMAQGYASMVGGFAGGASGSVFNGGDGWDVLKGGLMGAGMAYASGWVEDIIDPLGLHSSRSNIKSETTDFDKISDDTFIEGKYEDTSTKTGEKFKILKKSSRPKTGAESRAKARHLEFINDHAGPTLEHVAVYDKDGYYVGGTFSKGDAQQVFSTTRASRYLRFHWIV